MLQKIRDPVSCLTHLAGALLSIPCTVFLLLQAARNPESLRAQFGFAVFGLSLLLLYTASTAYHLLRLPANSLRHLRRIDHMMIFVLIAGTYTPVCLLPLRGFWGWTLLGLIWGFAAVGIAFKAFWLSAPRALSTGIYVLMGWLVIIAFYPLVRALSGTELALLICGGLCYTLGAVIYAVKWPPIRWPQFGFHELFHVFVLAGSAFHVLFMFQIAAG